MWCGNKNNAHYIINKTYLGIIRQQVITAQTHIITVFDDTKAVLAPLQHITGANTRTEWDWFMCEYSQTGAS